MSTFDNFQERNMNMKKVSLVAFAASLATTSLAVAEMAPCPKAFEGFGLGGTLGYDVGYSKTKEGPSGTKQDLGFKGIDGGILVDYTKRLCNWAVGVQFLANWANTKGKTDDPTKLRLKNSLDLLGRVGYVIGGQAMPYLGLGWENARWQSKNAVFGNKRKRLNGFLWAVGTDFLATKHVVLGVVYKGVAFQHKKFDEVSHRPQNNTFALVAKVVY